MLYQFQQAFDQASALLFITRFDSFWIAILQRNPKRFHVADLVTMKDLTQFPP
jgi:hypothetical protein